MLLLSVVYSSISIVVAEDVSVQSSLSFDATAAKNRPVSKARQIIPIIVLQY